MKQELKGKIGQAIEAVLPELLEIAKELYENPEIGGAEKQTSKLLAAWLETHGFRVDRDYWKMPFAFCAVRDSGKPSPVIGFFAEYDALPEIGHGCGHNLICTASMGAAYGLASVLDEIGGKAIVYGTPGEENIQSKTLLVSKGAFDEADVAMMVHPTPDQTAIGGRTLAIESVEIDFIGKSSHAGLAPEDGINALDAACAFYQMVNIQKQYYPETNVHGVILETGKKASVIPDFTSLHYLNRAWDMQSIHALKKMMVDCAAAAARMTGCKVEIRPIETNNAAMLSNQIMSKLFAQHLEESGETNLAFRDMKGSTDMGDVSQVIPSIHPWVHLPCSGGALHSRAFADATQKPCAADYLTRCAEAMALTAADILCDPQLLPAIQEEFHNSDPTPFEAPAEAD